MQIRMKTLTGQTLDFEVECSGSVRSVKEMLARTQGIPAEDSRLVYGGKDLEDEQSLDDYNIQDGCTLHHILRLRGGTLSLVTRKRLQAEARLLSDGLPRGVEFCGPAEAQTGAATWDFVFGDADAACTPETDSADPSRAVKVRVNFPTRYPFEAPAVSIIRSEEKSPQKVFACDLGLDKSWTSATTLPQVLKKVAKVVKVKMDAARTSRYCGLKKPQTVRAAN